MADEAKQDPNVVEKRETVEALDMTGKTMTRDTPLASIFDKIETGKGEGKSADEVIKEESIAPEQKKEEKKVEAQVEKKVEAQRTDLDKKLDEAQQKKDDAEEGSRAALNKTSEKKEEKKVEPADKKEEKKEELAPEEELQVLPHDKPKTVVRINTFLKKIHDLKQETATTKAERDDKATKLAELEKKLSEVKTVDPKTDEAIKSQLDELAMFRRRYDLEKDPEVKTKFDSRVESSEKSILDTLTRRGAGDPLINLIKEDGGWMKFADSGRVITLKDGTQTTAAQLAETIVQQLPISERRAIDAAMMEQVQLKRDKDRFFQEETSKATEHFKKRDEEAQKHQQEYQKQVEEAAKTIETWHKDVVAKNDWLKEKDIPANATPEQKTAIEEDNKYTRQLNTVLKKSLGVKDIKEALDVTLDSVKYYNERREREKAVAEITKLKADLVAKQTEIDSFKKASRSTKGGSLTGGGSSHVVTAQDRQPKGLEAAFDMAGAGKLSSDGKVVDTED